MFIFPIYFSIFNINIYFIYLENDVTMRITTLKSEVLAIQQLKVEVERLRIMEVDLVVIRRTLAK